ncbi:hypothetical protein B0T17DRAFT_489315 [Bombardia bombarda]|uniref:Uncharacterized protein n=1 Tax=Bombardia bombarda TaxID=252184 RepID=A0AA40C8M1_9PEZI|nr:hypothetical protein B0T17DRAFT_489315 [Bombardia bombarda]
MFLHSGASLHGHEYSQRQSSSSSTSSPQAAHNLRSPLLRSAFAPSKPRQNPTATTDGLPRSAVAKPVLRQRPASDYTPRAPAQVVPIVPIVRFRDPPQEQQQQTQTQSTITTPVMTDDARSESEFSDTTLSVDGPASRPTSRSRRHRRRAPRKTTMYSLGYPAPKILGKKKVVQKVLPRLLLQLQKVSADGRSRPVLEVFPSSRVAGPVITPRLAKRFPAIFGVKRQLGYDDLVLVRRDDSDSTRDSLDSDSDETLEKQKLMAVYSPLKNSDDAEIVLDDGSVWVAKPLANGSYDFVNIDDMGNTKTVRWARRSAAAVSPTGHPSETSPGAAFSSIAVSQPRFTFSIINPLSRRHPILASLTNSTLDVQDTYTSVSSPFSRYSRVRPNRSHSLTTPLRPVSYNTTMSYPASPPSRQSSLGGTTDGESDYETLSPLMEAGFPRTVHNIDDSTKLLISVTALWVALRSSWSPNYTPSHNNTNEFSLPNLPCQSGRSSRRNTWSRATGSDTGRLTPQLSESEAAAPLSCSTTASKHRSMPITSLEKTQDFSTPPSRSSTPVSSIRVLPRRATSTGAAFMQHHLNKQQTQNTEAAAAAAAATTTTAMAVTEQQQVNGNSNGTRKAHAQIATEPIGTPRSRDGTRALPCTPPDKDKGGGGGGVLPKKAVGDYKQQQNDAGRKGGLRNRLYRWIHRIGGR